MEQNAIVRSLGALAHPVRLQVFRALVVAGRSGMTPGTMAEGLASRPTRSRSTSRSSPMPAW